MMMQRNALWTEDVKLVHKYSHHTNERLRLIKVQNFLLDSAQVFLMYFLYLVRVIRLTYFLSERKIVSLLRARL